MLLAAEPIFALSASQAALTMPGRCWTYLATGAYQPSVSPAPSGLDMKILPPEARRRLSASVRPTEDHLAHSPAIPVTAEGWNTVLDDAGLVVNGELANALEAAHGAAASEDPTTIRNATRQLVETTDRVIADLRLVEALRPSGDGRTARAKTLIRWTANDAIEAVVKRDVTSRRRRSRGLSELVESMTRAPEVVDDRLEAIFGASRAELVDSQGRASVERIVATLHRQGRLGDDLFGPILAPITAITPPGFIRIRAALPHLTSPRPLLTLRTAVQVQGLILQRVAVDIVDTSAVLRTHKLGIERSAASHRGMMRVQAALAAVSAPSDVAYLTLDLYRRLTESQVRPWVWVLLRLTSATSRETPAELGTLVHQLTASPEPLLNAFAASILPAVRNAAAHEDFSWDHEAGALRVGVDLVTVSELEGAIENGYSMMIGAESGLACARADSHALARSLDADDQPGDSRTLGLAAALSRFGTNGLRVHSASWEGPVVVVELDEVDETDINPCFQAVIESTEWVAPEIFEIRVAGYERPIIRLRADAVHASRAIWMTAQQHFREMPTSVFLPLNIEARLDVDDLVTATSAAAWLALDGALAAYRDHDWWIPKQAEWVGVRLGFARRANELVRQRMPLVNTDPFERAARIIRDAETSASATAAGVVLPDPGAPIRQLQAAFQVLPRPKLLPTLGI